MKLSKGHDGHYYIVFPDSYCASKWEWLFVGLFSMRVCCFGQYENAFEWR